MMVGIDCKLSGVCQIFFEFDHLASGDSRDPQMEVSPKLWG